MEHSIRYDGFGFGAFRPLSSDVVLELAVSRSFKRFPHLMSNKLVSFQLGGVRVTVQVSIIMKNLTHMAEGDTKTLHKYLGLRIPRGSGLGLLLCLGWT